MFCHPVSLGSLRTRVCSCMAENQQAAMQALWGEGCNQVSAPKGFLLLLYEYFFPSAALQLPACSRVLASRSQQSHTTGFRVNTGYHGTPHTIAKALATLPHLGIRPHYPAGLERRRQIKKTPTNVLGTAIAALRRGVSARFGRSWRSHMGLRMLAWMVLLPIPSPAPQLKAEEAQMLLGLL